MKSFPLLSKQTLSSHDQEQNRDTTNWLEKDMTLSDHVSNVLPLNTAGNLIMIKAGAVEG